ncbi:unnamed protein product [Heterobilharzia americana]|nr:unnamed protein product [Heterobilharzia americana]
MSSELNKTEQYSQIDQPIKEDSIENDYKIKSDTTYPLLCNTLIDSDCKKMKLSDVWETSNTPPLESTLTLNQEISSEMNPKDKDIIEYEQSDTVHDVHHDDEIYKDKTKKSSFTNVKDESNYRITDNYETYHTNIEKDICTEFDNPMYIPIKLPLSSNLYVPVYYVQSSEEALPKADKHHVDYYHSNNNNNNDNISESNNIHDNNSTVSQNFPLKSNSSLRGNDIPSNLQSDYHINTSNQGYQNSISPYYTTEVSPNHHDLDKCELKIKSKQTKIRLKPSQKTKSKMKNFIQVKNKNITIKSSNHNDEGIKEVEATTIGKINNIDKRKRYTGCSPKLKFKKTTDNTKHVKKGKQEKKKSKNNQIQKEIITANEDKTEIQSKSKPQKNERKEAKNQRKILCATTRKTQKTKNQNPEETAMTNITEKKQPNAQKTSMKPKKTNKHGDEATKQKIGLTGQVSAPDVDVSVPSKKFTFGWGSKGKKAKKVKVPKVSGDVDAGLDVSGKVDVPSVDVDVDAGGRGKGKKFHWSPNISLPKFNVHMPDVSGKVHADAPDVSVSGTGPSVELPSVKASARLPTVDVSVPDASLGGDLSGKLDLDGTGVKICDADLRLPEMEISGNVSAPSVEGDLSIPQVSASLDRDVELPSADVDVKLPSVKLTGPDLDVHGVTPDAGVSAKVDVPKPHISIKAPKFGFGLGKKKAKLKTPKAGVKVEGEAGGKVDLDAGLDAHIDGKASKGGKKFHWSPKFGFPKGGLKMHGGGGVGKPDASISVSGPTGGVDVSLPKPELDVSLEAPEMEVSASVPEIGVSGGAGRGGELGLTGQVSAPDVDVSVPSKKFTFGWGSKGKKAKKVKVPKVSGDVDAGLDVSGKVDVPSVDVDVDAGGRGKGKKFHWSPNISLPKFNVHMPDVSGKVHADAPDVSVSGTGPSVELPSVKASARLPTVDVSVPDASLGGDLSGKLDLDGTGVKICDADLRLPEMEISGNVSAPSVEGDLSIPQVSASLDRDVELPSADVDVKLPSVKLTGPDLDVHGVTPDAGVSAKVDVPKPHISIKAPKFGFGLGKKKAKLKTPKAGVKVEGEAGGKVDLDAGLDAHIDGKASKGGKKFHWSPKFGFPKGGLKMHGGGGVGKPDASISVSGPTGGVDVSLPKPELDVSLEAPEMEVSASVPEIGVSGGAGRGGELGLTGQVSAPDVDVSVPSKKFTFGWGSKGKKAKKVKVPKVSGDVDAGLDVSGKVDVPSVDVDVDAGGRGKGKKFHWSPNISLPKFNVHMPDVSGKVHADAPDVSVSGTGPSVELPSVKASARLPTVDVSVPDASLGGDLSGKLDLDGTGVKICDADLRLPEMEISGNVSAPSVEGDLSIPQVSASLDRDVELPSADVDVKLPSVKLTGPDLDVHGVTPDAGVSAKVDVPKPHISIKAPKFGFGLGKKKAKLKTPKAGVKVEGEAGGKVDLDAGLDAHIDGKASKGGKKFHWSPKFGFPKGGLKMHGGGGVGKPDASISVSGPTGGVDVSLPKPELDVSLEAPEMEVSASVPEIGVSGGAGRGGELGLTGQVSAPDVDVSVPSKKFTFGWGSKGKKAKKVKVPKVSGDVDAGLDVSGKVDVPSVDVDVDAGGRGKGKKFHWSPNISLPKFNVHMPDVSGKVHADAPDVSVSGTGPSVELPSVKASARLPTVDVSVPDASLGGDLSGKLDLDGTGVKICDADLRLPEMEISGNVSAPSVEGDLSIPQVSASLDRDVELPSADVDVKLPSVKLTGPDLDVHGVTPDAGVSAKVDVPKPHISIKAPKFGFGLGKKKAKLKTPKAGVKVEGEAGGKVDLDAGLDAHIDGKASKGGKKFHWSPKFGFPKGGLKMHGGGGVGKPDASISVSGPTGGVDVSLPKPELDVSLEAPEMEVSASVPEIGVSGGAGRGGELGLTGQVSAPDVDVSVPSKKFTFGWGSKGKKAKKVKVPKVSGDVDAGLDVSGKVDVPSVDVDVDAGGRGKGKKFHWSPNISLPKFNVHMPDVSGKVHADAPDVSVSGTGPSVELPSVKASARLPTVDVSVPDASLGGDLSGKLDLDGTGVKICDADLRLPEMEISGNVSAPSVEGDLSIPQVSASLDRDVELPSADVDVKLPSVKLTGPDLDVHGVTPDAGVSAKVDVPKPHISIKAPKFGFGLGKKKAKLKTPKAGVKVEGEAGGKVDLDAGLDAHIDGKASKGGKKFHWSPKFGFPKGGLKMHGGGGVGKPDASISVSGPTGGVDVSLPKPELDVSLEAPEMEVSASVPEIGVSGGAGRGGELGLTGQVSAPDVDVSVPSKKFTFGWGSKGKKAKKVKVPKVSGDVDAGLDVSGKVDVPSVDVDVDAGGRGKGKKFHWSPNISLPKFNVHMPDVSGKVHADAPDVSVSGTGPSVELPSVKASARLPTVDVSVPDASLGGDLSGKLDLDGTGVKICDADLRLPEMEISGNVSAPSVEGDLSIPQVSASLDRDVELPSADVDVKLPSVKLTGPDLDVHGVTPDAGVSAKVDVPKPHISIKAPKFGFGLGKKKAKLKTPKAGVKVEGEAGGKVDLDAGLDAHIDGKASKGGKKFHWSPKFGFPKGGLKMHGGGGVGKPDASISVSGPTGGVDVSLPKPELDVSLEAPEMEVSASVPEIGVSGGAGRGGELGLTGQVSAPDVDVSVPSKKFTFGWGSKGKKAKKVKVPKVSGDVDAGLDVSGKVDVPSVDVDVDAGGRGKGKKFHWSPNISLPKFNVHMPDVSGKVHADAPDVSVSGTGPSVELPSVKASARLPTVDVSVPDASLGGDLSGKLDLDGTGVKICDADLRLPEMEISGNVSAPSVEGDLSIPQVSASLDRDVELPSADVDVKLPSVKLTGPDLDVHGVTPDAGVSAKVDVPKPHISIKAPKFGFGLGKKKAKLKTPKAGVKVEGEAGGKVDLDAGLDAHIDGKASKGGKKFHWSPKFGFPKGGLKMHGGGGVGKPDASISVSGPTGGVDVSLPKPELDVSLEAPEMEVSASVPEIGVSGGAGRGGELGLTGQVSAPDVDVSVPSKKFTFGWGSKGKKAKKVKVPKVSGDVDAGLDVSGKVDVPSVDVDVDAGGRGKGKKFHWSPNISLPKFNVHMPDVSGKVHADAPDVSVSGTGPSVELPSVKASARLPTVDVSVPDASLGGDLSGKLDLDGTGVKICDADLRLPEMEISGNVSAPSVEGDLSIPQVSASLDRDVELPSADVDVKLPSVKLTGPDLDVHGVTPDAGVSAKVDVPKPHISIKAPKFGFGLGKKKAKLKTPKAGVKVEGEAGGKVDLDAGLDAHIDGKASKGGKKFHWSPKFGFPKGGLKMHGGGGVGKPDASISVSGPTGGVDVSLPKPELDVSLEAPEMEVSASVPEIGVSGGAGRGGELGLTGQVSAPDVDVSVPSKKFTFGWGSKDVSGKVHADAPDVSVSGTGPSVELPSVKASARLPTVNVSVSDASLGGDLSGKLDLDGTGVKICDADLRLPEMEISGNVSAPSVEGDLSIPQVSASLDRDVELPSADVDVKLPSVKLTGPDLDVHGVTPDAGVSAKVDVPKPHISIKAPKFGFGLGKKKAKLKTPKAGVKVEGEAGGKVDLDAGLDAHIDGKASKGGKKFHWSPKFGFPKGGLKMHGGGGVGKPDASISVSGPTGGVDVSLPKPELDVSLEAPEMEVSASVPEIGVSGGAGRGGELGLTGQVSAPDVDVSVPSKKFTFGWGSKGKKAKKVKVPKVSGDVDAGLDVSGKVDVPSVDVDVDAGGRGKGKKFHWSPNISLPKFNVHMPDVSGKVHADAPDVSVSGTGPSVELPSVKASARLPTVNVSVPDASLGGDLSGKLDLDGTGVKICDADLRLPEMEISGNVSAPSVEGDLSIPQVSASLDRDVELPSADVDVKLPSVKLTGPDLDVHGVTPDAGVSAKVDVPKPHISIKAPKFGFGLGKKKAKLKTPKAGVKVEGEAGGKVDLDAGLDAHIDGKASKGGKKFHWSPKFGFPKGGLKMHGGGGVGKPDASISVSGPTGGVDVSLPKPELDVSLEAPEMEVSASVPEIGVSGGAGRGGELGLTGQVSAPDVDVSVPSKKFTFGWGSKGKKAKKVKVPKVSGDVDAGLDVSGKVDVPSVDVDVDAGGRGKGKKFHWSPNISLPKFNVHMPDVSGKVHADAPDVSVSGTGPSVELPSVKASARLPTVDVSVPDASLGGDLSGKLDLDGTGVKICDADLRLPEMEISGNVSAPSVEGDLSIPQVSASLDRDVELPSADVDVKLPSVKLTGPDLDVHGVTPDAGVSAKVDVPKPHISIKAPKFGFGLGKKKAKLKTPKAGVKVEGEAGGKVDLDAGLDAHIDGKASKGGKKFHWSPKFGFPKGGLKMHGGGGVGKPDASISVSGPTGGVDVSLPKPELDVSLEAPEMEVSASVPEIGVSGGAGRGGELGLTGQVSAPDVDVSVPSKKFTFGWGSKGKKAKKVKVPKVSGDVDAGLDVSGKVDVPSVDVDVDAGGRGKGKKFHWSPNISLPKFNVHMPDVSGKVHADAPDVSVSGTGPSVELPSVKASARLPTVDVSVPDASLGGDLSGKLDLDGTGVKICDADLRLPEMEISGNVSAPSVEGDLSIPQVSASLDRDVELPSADVDVKLPSVKLTGPDLDVHGVTPDAGVSAKVDVPKPHISIKAPKFGFGLGKKKAKLKTPKAGVKVEGEAGGKVDLDAGLDAHIDGKASKGGKKFHWSPKFGFPKGGLKMHGGGGVGKPDASISVSGPTGGVDVSLPKPELDVSLEAPEMEVSASVPEIGVSGGAGRGGELGLTGQVSAPDVDVSVPSKKFTFGWGSKGKKAKKVKVPKVSGDVDAGLDVSGKVDVPSVDVDVDAGGRGKGKKFHWSPNISLPKFNVHMPDVSGKVHADAPDVSVSGTGPSVELPSVKASARLPTVDVSVPDASLGGDLSGKLDLDGTGVKICDADLRLPEMEISGNVSAPSVEGDLSIPQVSASLDRDVELPSADVDVKLPSVKLTGPDLDVHGVTPDAGVSAKVDVPKPHISIKAPKFGFGLGKKKAKLKTPKAGVKVEGEAGGKVDLDAGLDAHIDGKASKGGKKFHWSPKFGFPKGGLKMHGGGGVGKPDASISVSGPTGGVDVSLPKPELDVSLEAPEMEVSASVPEIGVSGGAGRGGELGLTGQVSAPDVDVSVPSKKFTFGWGSKGKKAKKVKVPKVSGDVDAGLDVSGKVDVPSVDVDVDAGGRGKGKKFHWSPNISLPKFNVHMPDVSGKVHADAPDVSVSGTGPSVELPSVKASARLPSVDVSVPDASLGGDLSGFDSGSPLDVPDLLTDFSDSSVGYFGAGDLFPVSRCSVDYGIVAEEPVIAPVSARAEFSSEVFDSRLSPLYAFQDINETFSSPLDSGFNGDASYDDAMSADIDEIFIVPIHYSRVLPTFDASSQSATFENSADLQDFPAKSSGNISPVNRDTDMMHEALPSLKSPKTSFWPLELADAKKQKVHDSKPYDNSCPMNNTSVPRKISHPDHNQGLDFDSKNVGGENSSCLLVKQNHSKEYFDDHHGGVAICSSNFNDNLTSTPRRSPNKSRDPSIRKTWHGPREPYSDLTENNYPEEHEFTFTEEISDIHLKPMKITRNENNKSPNVSDFLRRSIVNTSKRRPWSTLEYPPPGCKFVDDDYLFPDALTPTKIPSFRASKEIVYDVPYMDDKALPTYEPEWPLGESRRTLISQLSQNSNSLIRITAEEESSLISLDTKLSDQQQHGSKRKNRFKANKKSTSTQDDLKIRSKSGNKFLTWWSKHGSPHK